MLAYVNSQRLFLRSNIACKISTFSLIIMNECEGICKNWVKISMSGRTQKTKSIKKFKILMHFMIELMKKL